MDPDGATSITTPAAALEQSFNLGGLLFDLGVVTFFILLASIFVAAEIALISLREGQVKALAERGKRGARVAALTAHPNRFLAAVQVGVTLSGFLSAAFGAERLGNYVIPRLIDAGLSQGVSETISLIGLTLIIAYFSLVFGELVPKRLALHSSEKIALFVATPVSITARFFRPLIWLLSHSSDLVLKLFGVDPKASREDISEEELVDLVTGHKALTEEERDIVEEVFNASERQVHEVMVPRTEVDFLDGNMTVVDATRIAVEKSHSRYPVVRGTSDEVIGFIHVRDLMDPEVVGTSKSIMSLVRDIVFLPGTKGVLPALSEMRTQRQQIAIVLDEYGGTDGIVTLEDLVETLIGDIHDEYDDQTAEVSNQSRTGDYEIDGLISLEDLAEQTGFEVPEGPYETLSGFVMHSLGRIPTVNDVIHLEGARMTILSMEGKRVGTLLLSRMNQQPEPTEN
ncbi:MAG: HlyC/CorC family transporter [Candidatus Nanopelagicaceae bacterium]|nr:HlyC/CorC family transporter [Candidatus Nanopelagicaceae bacterium]